MSSHAPRILLVSSEPFGGLSRNPAAELAREFDGKMVSGAEIDGVALPVSFRDLPARIAEEVGRGGHDAALGLGLYFGAAAVRVETTAINVADFDVCDNHGVFVRNAPIEPGGPAARAVTFDPSTVAEALREDGIPSRISHHAGTHLCNLTLYALLGAREGHAGPTGFLHLPLLPVQAAELMQEDARTDHTAARVTFEPPSMAFDVQSRAVEIVLSRFVGLLQPSASSARIVDAAGGDPA